MQTIPQKITDTSHDRLKEVGAILAKGICRLKQRQEKADKNNLRHSILDHQKIEK